ncbi:S8 family serine peptidase [Thiofilum flexile]|uniref:S8 family serine peptidase n=1 Tax=Thiofilum flexile TaxID=125627 RepID=UPI00035D9F7E|nr:S8 family serine peptidase [Thiofilum flexile]
MLISRTLSVVALLLALQSTTSFAAQTPQPASTVTELGTDQIIIRFKPNANLLGIDRVVNQLGGSQVDRLRYVRTTQQDSDVFKWERRKSRKQLDDLTKWLKSQPEVEYAEPDFIMTALALPNDTSLNYQWSLLDMVTGIRAEPAWNVSTGAGSVVAVIDTGYRPHADLVANLLPGYDMINDSSVAVDGNGRDADASDPGDYYAAGECGSTTARNSSWHGTHVAGTIAAVANNSMGIAGVAYNAKVVPVRVLGKCGGYTSDIADGMLWASGNTVSGAALNLNPAKVLNLSLGGQNACGTTTQNAINAARARGATVVVAAGNNNLDASAFSPANCAGVITVAATGRNGGKALYSNYGASVDIAAPGGSAYNGATEGILSTLNSGLQQPGVDAYAFYQGTSMATPHVAGIAALMYAVHPTITPDQVESILKSTARPFPATCNACGAGLVDAEAAVNAALTLKQNDPYLALRSNWLSNKALWLTKRLLSYTYVLEQQTGTSSVRYKITVQNGVVTAGINLANNRALKSRQISSLYTIDQLFMLVDQAIMAQYATIQASYDATFGYPSVLYFDPKATISGDESSYKVSGFTPL